MTKTTKLLTLSAIVAVFSVGGIVTTTSPASARVVCNRWGDCWHVSDRYVYPPEIGVTIYTDRYNRHRWRHRHWREEHEGRGYWRNGVWIQF